MTKNVLAHPGQAEARLYEVTASGIDQWWNFDIENPNRVLIMRADEYGRGAKIYECKLPFTYKCYHL